MSDAANAAGDRAKRVGASLGRSWGRLEPDQRLAAGAALALFLSMFLPWYRETDHVVVKGQLQSVTNGLNAFEVYSFVEAAIFVVAIAVLGLLWARAERKAFHLPGGDGTVIMGAGLWTMFLIFYRQFDRPGRSGVSVDVSVNWGIFIAFLLGALLAYAGFRIRQAHVPEPVVDNEPPPEAETVPAPAAADPEQTIVARRRGEPRPRTQTRPPGMEDGQLSFDEPAEYRPPKK
jgi:MFS family permease